MSTPVGVSSAVAVRSTAAQVQGLLVAILGVPFGALCLIAFFRGLGWSAPVAAAAIASVVVASLTVIWRMLRRRVVLTADAVQVQRFGGTQTITVEQIHHVDAALKHGRSRRGVGGWTAAPVLVLTQGQLPVRLGPLGMYTSDYDFRFRWQRRHDGNALAVLDSWLAAKDVPVTNSYDALHSWAGGSISLGRLRGVVDLGATELHLVVPDEPTETVEPPPAVSPRDRRRARRLRTVGWVLLALFTAVTLCAEALVALDLVTGQTVSVQLTATLPDDRCVLTSTVDPTQTWQTRCRSGWRSNDVFPVRIGGQSNQPVRAAQLVLPIIAGLFLACLALVPFGVAHLVSQPAPDLPSAPDP
jgi:hypothetical protein